MSEHMLDEGRLAQGAMRLCMVRMGGVLQSEVLYGLEWVRVPQLGTAGLD